MIDYMQHLTEVARRMENMVGVTDIDHLGRAIQSVWADLEDCAKMDKYDVLDGTRSRALARLLGSYLYSVPGADPDDDVDQLVEKDKEYGGSWCKRGGQGAFMMAARKWDRVEHQIKMHGSLRVALEQDTRPEGILDDLGDLRRYLLLWEAYHVARG